MKHRCLQFQLLSVIFVKICSTRHTTMRNYLRALRDMFVIDVQEAKSRCLSLEQNLLRLVQVASVVFVHPLRLSTSIFLQFCAKVLSALSPTPRHPRRLNFRKKPPHRLEIFSTTRPSMSLWKSNRSIRCQLLPSRARTFQALET